LLTKNQEVVKYIEHISI